LHDAGGDRAQTIAALPRVIEGIKAKGLDLVAMCQPDVHIPKGAVETVEGAKGRVRITGWVHDPDVADPIQATVLVDGTEVKTIAAADQRPELAERGLATAHGFDLTVQAAEGVREICVRGVNVGQGSTSPSIGCMTAEVLSPVPLSIVDAVNRTRFVRSVIQLRLADPPLRVRQAWAAYWSVLLLSGLRSAADR
ncbi:MAG: hypothetical protein M3Z03_17065, partial [Actinomycetota bacterium]|nr:hypothetical protein [Actinomycetota bacterium]